MSKPITLTFKGINNLRDSYEDGIDVAQDMVNMVPSVKGVCRVRKGFTPQSFAAAESPFTPGGRWDFQYGTRLFRVSGNSLLVSTPFDMAREVDGVDHAETDRIDEEIVMNSVITMALPVMNGLYVSDNEGVYFFAGDDVSSFVMNRVSPYPAIIGTGVLVSGQKISQELSGDVALWTGEDGCMYLGSAGAAINLTGDNLVMDVGIEGAATVVEQDGSTFYMVTTRNDPVAGEAYIPKSIVI